MLARNVRVPADLGPMLRFPRFGRLIACHLVLSCVIVHFHLSLADALSMGAFW